jgi:hypothetical protein
MPAILAAQRATAGVQREWAYTVLLREISAGNVQVIELRGTRAIAHRGAERWNVEVPENSGQLIELARSRGVDVRVSPDDRNWDWVLGAVLVVGYFVLGAALWVGVLGGIVYVAVRLGLRHGPL